MREQPNVLGSEADFTDRRLKNLCGTGHAAVEQDVSIRCRDGISAEPARAEVVDGSDNLEWLCRLDPGFQVGHDCWRKRLRPYHCSHRAGDIRKLWGNDRCLADCASIGPGTSVATTTVVPSRVPAASTAAAV